MEKHYLNQYLHSKSPVEELLLYALAYAALGWRIHPCRLDKTPYLRGGYKQATTDEAKIREWWSRWPGASIGCATGEVSGIWVLDADLPDGPAYVKRMNLPPTLTQRTGGGGLQMFFRCEGIPIRNSAGKIAKNIDVRGNGGYVILPPSPHPSGMMYKWIEETAIAEAPDWLIEKAIKPSSPPSTATFSHVEHRGDASTYGRAAFHDELALLAAAREGVRNDQLNRSAHALGQLVAGGELSETEALTGLQATALFIGLPEKEARKTIKSGMDSGKMKPRQKPKQASSAIPGIHFSKKEVINAAYGGQKGSANLFIKMFNQRFRFDHTDGTWFEFKEHYYQVEDIGRPIKCLDEIQNVFERTQSELEGDVIQLGQKIKNITDKESKDTLKAKIAEIEAQTKIMTSAIKNLNTLGFRKNVVEFAAQGEGSLGISGTEWDKLPWALPCKNGVIDLKSGKLRDGNPDDFLKSVSPTVYNPEARCPLFERALRDIFDDDQQLMKFWQRVCGMAIVGENTEHVLIVLYGAGRNGKDVVMAALAHVLGDSLAGAVQSELLLEQGRYRSSNGPSADIMRLRGLRRLAWASETNEGRRMDAGKIKLLTGGGDLVGRAPYARREVSFPQSYSLFLLTNSKPHASADDYALWKRIKLVPFSVQFVDDPKEPNEKQRDKDLLEKLKPEASGILHWLVDGCLEWQRNGLKPPDVVEQATDQYREEEDILLSFIEDTCVKGPNYHIRANDFYSHYKQWMLNNGLKPMSGTKFGQKMKKCFDSHRDAAGQTYQGIKIRSI
jgi:putative DNA primase/helicase